MATMTLIGMYNYDPSLFDLMTLPDNIDKDTAINTILQNSGEFEVLYADVDFTKNMIGHVAKKWYGSFKRWADALEIEYNPIYNYDRFEDWTEENKDSGTVKRSGTDSGTIGNTEKSSSSESSSGSGQTDTFVNAYNNNTLVQDGQSKSTQSAKSSGEDNTNNTETRNLKNSNDETRNLQTTGKHTGHLYGNIGVTTSQQMLQAEFEVAWWNLYDHVSDIFIRELCIPIYG